MTNEESRPVKPRAGQPHAPYKPGFTLIMGAAAPILCLALQPVLLTGDLAELPGLRYGEGLANLRRSVVIGPPPCG